MILIDRWRERRPIQLPSSGAAVSAVGGELETEAVFEVVVVTCC
jgi:hypothetical protein